MSAPAVEGGKHAGPNAGAPKQQVKSTNGGKALDGARKQAGSPVDGQSRKQPAPAPRAWQGPNPITHRPSPNSSNGGDKASMKSSSQPLSKAVASSPHSRLSFLTAHFVGLDATLTLRSGEQFSGVFSGSIFEGQKSSYVLKMVKKTKLATSQAANGESARLNTFIGEGEDHTMTFNIKDTIDLKVENVSLASTTSPNGTTSSSFRTDTEISGRDPNRPRERELQRWEPAGDSSIDMSLDASGSAGWDQFETNQRMYGVQSTYDENIYTTQIDRTDPKYKAREARAAQLAREIEGSAPADAHVAEERRLDTEMGDGLDEEEKYSGVRRDAAALPKRGANSYIPPSQRPITNTPTVHGAPYDPAIISSSLAKPSASPAPEKLEATKSHDDPSANASKEVPSLAKKDNSTEDHVRSTADAFKQFANFEKLRVRQAQEAKRSNQRHEKNVKLNDLKKFAANFKLNSRVPDDLVPILAKDREKQVEIQRKAEDAAKEDEVRRKDKEREKAAGVSSSASPALSTTASQTSTTPSGEQRTIGSATQSRPRQAQPVRPPVLPAQTQPARTGISQRNQMYRGGLPNLPTDLKIPAGPTGPSTLSPSSATRLNVNAFEFRPGANSFAPPVASPSPQRKASEANVPPPAFFTTEQVANEELKDIDAHFGIINRILHADVPEEQKKAMASNGGIPLPYRTQPTWNHDPANNNVSYKDAFPKLPPSQGPSPLHTPGANGPMPHAHQLPSHMQGPHAGTPSQRPIYFNPQQHPHGQPFDPRMQQFGPNGSVQNSPRFPPAQMAFNGQMPPQMQMQQYPGQPMPGYGMSPSMQYRQLPVQQGGGPIMMMPGQQPNQMQQMRGPAYGQGPQFGGPQMGGHMMQHNPSGGYMNGPMPQQQPYSPMPPHNQQHMPHMQHGPGGFGGSPRPPMMQHSGSHQGYQPQMHLQQQAPYAPSPSQHGYHLAHSGRQMSSGHFPQMTPRQQAAVPQHPSPGMANASQGDEGK